MINSQTVATVIESISNKTLDYALLLAAIGTLSMAVIEVIKGLFKLRCAFHRRELTGWMPDDDCRRELLVLSAGGEQYADVLLDQPIEKMMGQIQAAANLALEYPDRYRRMYDFFTNEDMKMSLASFREDESDNVKWANYAARIAKDGVRIDANQRMAPDKTDREAQQARVRLGNLIARRLDMFQNRTQYRWARYNQAASIIIGIALTAYALSRITIIESGNDAFALACLSFLAGMLAPFAKDVVSAIAGIRVRG